MSRPFFARFFAPLGIAAALLQMSAAKAEPNGCSANAVTELIDGFYQCRDRAPGSSASLEVHAAILNPAEVRSRLPLQGRCTTPVGDVVACTYRVAPASMCSVNGAGIVRFGGAAGTCVVTISTPARGRKLLIYRQRIAVQAKRSSTP
jgi:hypothetical protein